MSNSSTIWRYSVPITDHNQLHMPVGAIVLDAQRRNSDKHLDVWALVDPLAPIVPVQLRIAGTGHPIGPQPSEHSMWRYISTVQVFEGTLVFHVFVQEFYAEKLGSVR